MLAIHEVNTNTFAFEGSALADGLGRITNDNPAGEYYIGDVLEALREQGRRVLVHKVDDVSVNIGINTRVELAVVSAEARRRILERHMLAGVTIADPEATWIDAEVEIEADAVIEPGTTLRGRTRVGRGSVVGPHTTLIDSSLGAEVSAPHSYLVQCEVADGCQIGPFASPAPGRDAAQGRQGGRLRRDQELGDRRGGQGPAPVLRRRRRGRRRLQRRGRNGHRQLRRLSQAPDEDRGTCANRIRHDAGRPRQRRR